MKRRSGFSLVELLVVMLVIAILASILLPALRGVVYSARNIQCVNNLRQMTHATVFYCGDNRKRFPDRGIDLPWQDALVARWAMRMSPRGGEPRLDTMLTDYVALEAGVWCCALYQGGIPYNYGGQTCSAGGRYGCPKHGLAHNPDRNHMTYGFHGGIKEFTESWALPHVYNPGDRRILGQPYEVKLSNGSLYRSRMLWSDSSYADDNWVPAAYPGQFVTSPHMPPPGVEYAQVYVGSIISSADITNPWVQARTLAIFGETLTSWAYDDGSAKSRRASPVSHDSSDWTGVWRGREYMLFPND